MDISSLHDMIETAVAIEAKQAHLANLLDERARAKGHTLGERERREALDLFEGYIRSVPELLAAAEASSVGTPVEAIMAQVIRAAVAYWDEAEDLVPDELGVLGLLDDAYFSLQMLRSVSDRLEAESGHKLIAEDLSSLDAIVRDLLGGLTGVLDEFVTLSLSNAPVDELIAAVAEHAGSFETPVAKTPFRGRSVDDLVEAHLSFASYGQDGPESSRDALIDSLARLSALLDGDAPSLAEVRGEAFTHGAQAVEELLRVGLDDDEDVAAALALLTGLVIQRRVVAGHSLDRELIGHSVDLILDGAGWTPS